MTKLEGGDKGAWMAPLPEVQVTATCVNLD